MREPIYIPGQDDFPGWDEFYTSRLPVRERMKFSIKTLLLLPPLIAFICFAYVTGYRNGNRDEVEPQSAIVAARQAREGAESLARTSDEAAKAERQASDRANRQTQLAEKLLNALVFDIVTKMKDAPGTEEARRGLLHAIANGLKETARSLDAETSIDPETLDRRLNVGRLFLLLSAAGEDTLVDARQQFAAAHEMIFTKFHAAGRDDKNARNLFTVDSLLADVHLRLAQVEEARDDCLEALEMIQTLAQAKPQDNAIQRELSIAHGNLADAQMTLDRSADARRNAAAALEISRALAKADAKSDSVQRDLFVALGRLGDAELELCDATLARSVFVKDFALSHNRVLTDPRAAALRRDLYVSFEQVGDGNRRSGELKAAAEAFELSLHLARTLADKAPQDAQAQSDLAHALARLGYLEMAREDFSAAAVRFQQAIVILEPLDDEKIAGPRPYQAWLKDQREKLQACQLATGAIDDLSFVLRQSPAEMPRLLAVRARALARRRQYASAMLTADKLVALQTGNGEHVFAAAEAYALCAVRPAESAPQAEKASQENKELRARCAARAVDLLRQANTAGYFNEPAFAHASPGNHNFDSLFPIDDGDKLPDELDADIAKRLRNDKR